MTLTGSGRCLGMLASMLWVIGLGVVAAADADPARPPNILVISVDTFRADHLGAYGYGLPTSPHIDSIAADGVVFANAYTTSAWTAPGLISLLTSQYAPTHGVDVRGKSIRPEVVTLADALRAGGYRAPDIFFLTDIPNFHHLGFEPYANRSQYIREGDEILFRWLQEEAPRTQQPFFLYYHYRDLHQPYAPGPMYEEMFLRPVFGSRYNPLSWARRFLAREKMDLVQREVMMPRGIIDFATWDKPWVDALYDGQIRRLDTVFFGRLRRLLATTGLRDNTLVVISADHGEELLEHGLVGHVSTFKEGSLAEELVRIPLIIAGPGLPSGRVVDTPVQVIDTMPTLLDLAGLPPALTMQGRSLLPLVEPGGSRVEIPLYFETTAGGYTASLEHYAHRTRAVRSGDWKLITRTPSGTSSLYNLAADPHENDNVADVNPVLVDSLTYLLDAWLVASTPSVLLDMPLVKAPAASGLQTPVHIEFPADGDTLQYVGVDQTIRLQFTGQAHDRYHVLYNIGRGVYHLEGEMDVDSNSPSYGPFQASFWNSLVLYNPFSVRVHPVGRPDLISPPVTFYLQSSAGGGLAQAPLQALLAVQGVGVDLLKLTAGIALGLVDLSVWLTQAVSAADVTAWALLLAIAGALVWPRLQGFGEQRVRAWAWVVAYIFLVYSTIAVFPQIWGGLRRHTGDAIGHLGTIAVVVAVVWVGRRLYVRIGRSSWIPYGVWLLLICAYAFVLSRFGQFPAERLHLLEYGVMGTLLYRALLCGNRSSVSAYALALLLTVVIGFGDETIQWVLPQRFFELKDVGLNAIAGSLGLALTRLVRGRDT